MADQGDSVSYAESGDEPLRIALVLATSAGGVGRHVRAAATGLARAGHRVVVLGPAETDRTFEFSTQPGIVFQAVEIASGWRPLLGLRASWRVHRLVRDAGVVHAHGLRAGCVAALALCRWPAGMRRRSQRVGRARALSGEQIRRPVFVVTLHNAMLGNVFRRRLLGFVMRCLARASDLTLVVSADLAAALGPRARRVTRALVASVLSPPAHDGVAVRGSLGLPVDVPVGPAAESPLPFSK